MAGERRALALRLVTREYLPLASWLAMWAVAALALRPADAVRLLAATLFTRVVRELVAMDTGAAMRRRSAASREVAARSMRVAVRVEAVTLLISLAALAAIVLALAALDQPRAAWLTAILGLALPARHFMPANCGHRRQGLFPTAAAAFGTALMLGVLGFSLGLEAAAWAMVAREYLALILVLFWKPDAPPRTPQLGEALRWGEVAAITAAQARVRFAFRVSKGLLSVFGPLGSIVARTGRGVGAHRRLERFTPSAPWKIAALGALTAGAALALLVIVREPATLVIAAGLLRVSAAATSTAVWSGYADRRGLNDAGGLEEED